MAEMNFGVDDVEAGQDFDALSPGWYEAQIVDSELKDNSKGTGSFLSLEFEVVSGDFQNRKFWMNVNYQHTNPKAQEIGQQELRRILEAVGLNRITDSSDLHFKPMMCRLAVENDNNGNPRNVVKRVGPADGKVASPTQQSRQSNPSTARQTQNGGAAPSRAAPNSGVKGPWQARR